MKNTQQHLLSIVFSLMLITGVSAASVYADSDDLDDKIEDYCEFSDTQKDEFFSEYPELSEYEQRLASICEIEDEDEREDALEELADEVVTETRDDSEDDDDNEREDDDNEREDDDKNSRDSRHDDLEDRLEKYCNMSDTQKEEFFDDHPKMSQFADRLESFCSIEDEDEREDAIEEFVDSTLDGMDEFKESHKIAVKELQEKHKEVREQKLEYKKLCKMTPEERENVVNDAEELEKISQWCEMTPSEQAEYKKEHHDAAMEYKEKHHDALATMKENKDLSPRLKAMIMEKMHDSEMNHQKIKAKYAEKYGKDSGKVKMELKEKFRDHKSEMKFRFAALTDQQKSEIMDRYEQMKEFKSEISQSDLTQAEIQDLRAQFIEDAKNMQLAWITPRDQVSAGIDPDMIECREGFSLVMKTSNGLPMCVKTASALTMIERGIVVPAN